MIQSALTARTLPPFAFCVYFYLLVTSHSHRALERDVDVVDAEPDLDNFVSLTSKELHLGRLVTLSELALVCTSTEMIF